MAKNCILPMAAESFGVWHGVAKAKVKKLGAALARNTGQEEGEAGRHLWGRLGILPQRGNVAILANHAPNHPTATVDGMQ